MSPARALSLVLLLSACPARTPAPAAPTDVAPAAEPQAPPAPDVPHVTVGPGAAGPWRDARLVGAATSQAVWVGDRLQSLVAVPATDGSHARLSWVRWGAQGAEIVAQADAPAMAPGASLALVPAGEGWVAVWRCEGADGGVRWCAQPLGPQGFAGGVRDASETERAAAGWCVDLLASRRPDRADLLPAEVRDGAVALTVRPEGRGAVLRVDATEVLRGGDLRGYAPAMVTATHAGTRWIALSRGRCQDTRVELWSLRDGRAALRASFAVGAEVGFRWMRLEPAAGRVALTWYQDLIPIRLPCARPDGGPNTAEHGVRVARVVE
ncbi:MAG: hypothetical protein U0325_17600 [Polyangiales bacterium]